MAIDVIMPQMGESILEGTVTKWLKQIGDTVVREAPLFEVSTDKVDSEIPAPADGVLSRILVAEGQTVKVGTVVAMIEEAASAAEVLPTAPSAESQLEVPVVESEPPAVPEEAAAPVSEEKEATAGRPEEVPPEVEAPAVEEPQAEAADVALPALAAPESEAPKVAASEGEMIAAEPSPESAAPDAAFVRTSPLVRRIARDYGVNLSDVEGSGLSGRITKEDIFSFLERQGREVARPVPVPLPAPALGEPVPTPISQPQAMPVATPHEPLQTVKPPTPVVAAPGGTAVPSEPEQPIPAEIPKFYGETEIVTMTPMRKAIAEHMVVSKRTSAHVQTVFEVDMTSIVRLREKHKEEFEAREGFKLTYTPFFVKALVDTVRDFPILNCSVSGDKIIFKKPINVGIAVALDTGLIVPVVKDAHLKSFTSLALAVHDIAERARTKRLKPEEVQQGTISITNPGIFGSLFGTPIISQPQVAILGVGSLQKRAIIINDAIAIRTMVYLVLSFDHRVIDGAVADQAMAALKSHLQSWNAWVE